jgi:squalene/oxidosqualene cyclase-like protein
MRQRPVMTERPDAAVPGRALAGGPLAAAVANLLGQQDASGCWEGEVGWNTMLLSQYVLTCRMVGRWPLPQRDRGQILRHYQVTRRGDGSWPLHGEAPGSLFVTVLAYVALRVLGVPVDDPLASAARRWLWAHPDDVTVLPSWGRMWLAMLGLYEYEGINPLVPETVLLPGWAPVHPDRLYVHTRMIYFGLSCLYARRARFDLGPLTGQLRAELYDRRYESIDFAACRGRLAAGDVFVPPSRPVRLGSALLARYERHPVRVLREAAVRRCLARVTAELEASDGQGVSPVSALLGCLAQACAGAPHDAILQAVARLDAWRWEDQADGLRIAGARSLSWDTAFALRALLCAPATPQILAAIGHGYRGLAATQATGELPAHLRHGRDRVLGGWSFSDGAHRWPVSDCTAEALSAVLLVHRRADLREFTGPRLPDPRLYQAVEFILSRQNPDGGFGTYERTRGPAWLEKLNSTEMYAGCMTDFSCPEPTASCVSALARFRHDYPGYQPHRVDNAIRRGARYLRSCQRPDGSYEGSWGINFTYAACFVTEALLTAGVPASDPAISGAVSWLRRHQKPDGGWGEHYTSCLTGRYTEHPDSQAAMTAWALLVLLRTAGPGDPDAKRALRCLVTMQQQGTGGGWPHQAASGVFFHTAVLDYRLYKDTFPTWALAAASTPRQ